MFQLCLITSFSFSEVTALLIPTAGMGLPRQCLFLKVLQWLTTSTEGLFFPQDPLPALLPAPLTYEG